MRRATLRSLILLSTLAGASIGCKPAGGNALVIASSWPRASREALIASYRRDSGSTWPIVWVELGPGDRVEDAVARRGGVDLILGGSPRELERMAATHAIQVPWRLIHRPGIEPPPDSLILHLPSEFADLRNDPTTLGLIAARLQDGDWKTGYADLVHRAAKGRPSSRAVSHHDSALMDAGRIPERTQREGVAISATSRAQNEAKRFLGYLETSRLAVPVEPFATDADDLLADLIGATMVDAHDEMRAALVALEQNGNPAKASIPFVEAPPWPPASVARLRSDPADLPLIETLAEQIAPEPDVRAWLLKSWARPVRPIDGTTLDDLARAAGGALAREPRFRAWLRAEWTAWARQRYRRVARVAGGWVPS